MKSVKAHRNTKLVKEPRKPKASKWAKDAQGKTKGTQEPISKKAHGRVKPLEKEYTADLKETDRIKSLQQEEQSNTVGRDDNQGMGWKKCKAQYKRKPSP